MREAIEHGNAKASELSFLRPVQEPDVEPPPSHDDPAAGDPADDTAEEIPPGETGEMPYSFIAALGIDTTVSKKSTRFFNGDYLQFFLNDQEQVVTTRCHLSEELGADQAPILSSSRCYPGLGTLESVGAYFFSDRYLYLVASPRDGTVDLRLSVFNAIGAPRQTIIRGMVLGVGLTKVILSSRCVMVASEHICEDYQNELYAEPVERSRFEAKMVGELSEISGFLFGEEAVDYIRLMKLTPQS